MGIEKILEVNWPKISTREFEDMLQVGIRTLAQMMQVTFILMVSMTVHCFMTSICVRVRYIGMARPGRIK